ncbi:MAG: EamA family transporter [Opitutaceae bacterium]
MLWLLLVSFVWAFSFGLIKDRLTGIDSSLVAFFRLFLALLVFLPFARGGGLRIRDLGTLGAIGAIQFGVMYIAYIAAFAHLAAYEVAVLSIFTPLLVCIVNDALERRFNIWPFVAAAVATAGAAVILMERPLTAASWGGVVLMQLSNLCFALGQVAYSRWKRSHAEIQDARVFFVLYLGAVAVTAVPAAQSFDTLANIGSSQWMALLYLGVVASGLGFFAWNYGAARTPTGLLAVVNNAKIPLAVACSVIFFGEQANLARLLIGGALIVLAGALAHRKGPRPQPSS